MLIKSDQLLLERALGGNELAFKELVKRHQGKVRSVVRSMLEDTPEVDDVTQEVFIRFYKAMEQFKAESKLSTYLTRIAINLSLNELKRRKQKWRIIPLLGRSDTKAARAWEIEDDHSKVDQFMDRQSISVALNALPPIFKAVVILRLVEGYSVKETAELMNLPVGTVASRLARAQKLMIKYLSKSDV